MKSERKNGILYITKNTENQLWSRIWVTKPVYNDLKIYLFAFNETFLVFMWIKIELCVFHFLILDENWVLIVL